MIPRNLTPFLFGAKVTSRLPPQPEAALIVRGSFTLRQNESVVAIKGLLEQGSLTADVFEDDDEDRVGASLYPNDFADYKPHAEVYLVGSCYPPGGKAVRECGVRFSVGKWSKSLFVVGKRHWGTLGPSSPDPFETMPIGWANSFGGPKFEKNPSGKGFGTPDLPNVESPSSRVSGKSDRPDPAGFGPLNPWWPQRAGKMGKEYSGASYKKRAPFYAEDFDWTHFNGAPADQQLKGFLQGDEEITLQNLHPAAGLFSTRLPGLRIRAFIKDAEGAVHEARMHLDTLLVDTDEQKVVLTWRGHVPCKETDLSDMKTALIASENLVDTPLPPEHYKKLLEEFHADPIGVIREEIMPGAGKKLEIVQAAAKDFTDHPERTPAERAFAVLENDDLVTIGMPEADKPEALKNAAAQRDKLKEAVAKEKAEMAKVDEMLAKAGKPPRETPKPKTANEIAEEAPDVRAQVLGALKQARAAAEKAGAPPEQLARLAELDQIERKLDDPLFKKGLAMATPPRAADLGPGKDLSNRVMTGRDLSGLDLSGANLQGAILSGARLVGTRLAGANLSEALLLDTDLAQADLSGANLTRALVTRARAPGADFRNATLDMAMLGEADLKGANFAGAKGDMIILSGANLTNAKFNGVDLIKVFADRANLEGADFTDAKLTMCSFMRVKAGGAIFKKAVLTNTSFMESDLQGATFVEASGEQTSWIRADIAGADFRFAILHAAHFMETKAVGAKFYGADLRGSEFIRACLDRALFRKANLFEANLDKAELNEANFLDANLYGAKLAGAHGKDTIFVGANTKKATLPS